MAGLRIPDEFLEMYAPSTIKLALGLHEWAIRREVQFGSGDDASTDARTASGRLIAVLVEAKAKEPF
jgi:hypothetical protein